LGQHSYNPPRPNSTGRSSSQAKRRWAAVAAGAAVVAAASTTAWAAVANEDAPKPAAMNLPPAAAPPHTPPSTSPTTRSSERTTTTRSAVRTTGQVKSDPTPRTSRPNTPAESAIPRSPSGPSVETVAAVSASQESKPQQKAKKKAHVISTGTCGASYYAEGQMTASGERFNPSAMTAAHRTLPMGSRVRVTNRANGESVTVRINDRGPYIGGRCLDLSRAAFAAIGKISAGVMRVKYEVLSHS
jgi:rare lipoprotein A